MGRLKLTGGLAAVERLGGTGVFTGKSGGAVFLSEELLSNELLPEVHAAAA
jgi:hypothetical protein